MKKVPRNSNHNLGVKPKINLLSQIWFWFISNIKFRHCYFFDTGIIVRSPGDKIDKRHWIFFSFNNKFLLAENIYYEINRKIEENKFIKKFWRKLKIVKFEDLRERYPASCPIYYNYIRYMYNPAVLNDPLFLFEMIFSSKIRKKETNLDLSAIYSVIGHNLNKGKNNLTNKFGKKSVTEQLIDKSYYQVYQKKKKATKKMTENYFNDYRHISLAILYCVINKVNTTIYTADLDYIANIFNLVQSIAQEMTFKMIYLPKLGDEGKKILLNGGKITYFIDKSEFDNVENGVLAGMISNQSKQGGFYFKIMYWDKTAKKYLEGFKLIFDESMREIFLNSHSSLSCGCSKNNTYGNWIHCQYWGPGSIHDLNFIKIRLWKKSIINFNDKQVSDFVHMSNCYYYNMDILNELKDLHSFYL